MLMMGIPLQFLLLSIVTPSLWQRISVIVIPYLP